MGRSILAFIFISALLVLAGCVTAANDEAVQAQAKQLAPQLKPKDPHLARLYFIRPAGYMAMNDTLKIKISGQELGAVPHGSYIFADRPPGTYTLEVVPMLDWASNFQTDVAVAAGQSYYYAITVKGSTVPLAGGGFVRFDQANPGRPAESKNGISFATFKLNVMDPATGAVEIARLSNH